MWGLCRPRRTPFFHAPPGVAAAYDLAVTRVLARQPSTRRVRSSARRPHHAPAPAGSAQRHQPGTRQSGLATGARWR
ncbi:hypothetical protein DAPPUDRAFT_280063, partial [Daphnia pulex]